MRLYITLQERAMNKSRIFVFGVLLCAAISFSFGANIKDISVHSDAKERLDVLLKLDSAFNGEIKTTQNKKITIITNTNIAKSWSKSFTNAPIKKLNLFSRNNHLYIDVESSKQYNLKPSISKDKNTMRLSFISAESNMTKNLMNAPTTIKPAPIDDLLKDTNPKTQDSSNDSNSTLDSIKNLFKSDALGENLYYVFGFVGVLIILLLLRYQIQRSSRATGAIKVAAQNQIDSKNKIVIFETRDYFYMVLIGEQGSVLIDKISRDKITKKRNTIPLQSTSQTIGNDDTFNDDFWNSLTQGNLHKKAKI